MLKKIFFISLIFLLAIILFLLIFVSKPLFVEDGQIKIIREMGKVSIKISGEENYLEIENELIIKTGDEIKTASDSRARIVFYDTNEVTVDENTELIISQAMIDKNSPFLTKISLKLKTGQIWSRLQSFINPEALFEIEAEDVVATVRGTSFNVSNKEQKIIVSVFENVVEVNKKNDFVNSKNILESYKKITFSNEKNILGEVEDISQEEKDLVWVKDNLLRNQNFSEELKKYNGFIIEKNNLKLSNKFYFLKFIGEKIRIFFTSDLQVKEDLKNNFIIKKTLLDNPSLENKILVEKTELDTKLVLDQKEDFLVENPSLEELEDKQEPNLSNQDLEKENVLVNDSIKETVVDEKIKEEQKSILGIKILAERNILNYSDMVELKVFLLFSDNTKKDITKEVKFVLDKDDLTGVFVGDLRENIFIANQNGGLAYITAFYDNENNVSLSDKIILTVLN